MKVDVNLDDRHFIVVFDEEKGTALVKERVVIFEGKRRKFYDEEIRWFHDPPFRHRPSRTVFMNVSSNSRGLHCEPRHSLPWRQPYLACEHGRQLRR